MLMPPESPNRACLLLFGTDRELLETRAEVLRTVGIVVDTTTEIKEVRSRIAKVGSPYDGVVCCYTVAESECNEMKAISQGSRMPLLMLEPLLSPMELIHQSLRLVGSEAPEIRPQDDGSSQ